MSAESRVREDERAWHEELFRERSNAELVVSDAIRRRYLQVQGHARFGLERMFQLAGDVRGKRVLIVGCGDANTTVLMAFKGAEVWATDISFEAAKIQERMAQANGMQEHIHAAVCGAEELPFPADSFDIVFGSAVLHHLPDHLAAVSSEVRRVTREGGFVLFSEPVARSPFLQRIRRLFPPPHISPGERQLTDADLEQLMDGFTAELLPYNLVSRLTYFTGRKPLENASIIRRAFVRALHWSDYFLFKVSVFDRFAGGVTIKMHPKKAPPPIVGTSVEPKCVELQAS
ncbi:MAG TPA: class I SAM-dependent methyltransferase [Candidatus Acidoferrales bacterium]|nr:class I SAM-dependent methyltransferase [Candidatus Acidoferrales bacterium]